MKWYLGVIERGETGFGIFFPDVPGCVSAGNTIAEAASGGTEALQAHLELTLESGFPFPEPSGVIDMPLDPEIREVTRVLIGFEPSVKPVRININLPENLLVQADRYAASHGTTRSGLLATALREHIRRDEAATAEKHPAAVKMNA